MTDATKKAGIYEAIVKCMEDIGAVGKDAVNKQQGFKYRGVDAVMNAINPALIKNHVFIVPEVLEQSREERTTKSGGALIYSVCRIKYTFYAEDGSYIEAITVGEGMDSGDKATNKAMAIAFKYACFQVFCIPTEEMKDPDEETPEPIEPRKPARSQFVPATPEQLHKMDEFITAYAEMCENATAADIVKALKDKYHFNGTGEISKEMADQITKQLERWYMSKKKKNEGGA